MLWAEYWLARAVASNGNAMSVLGCALRDGHVITRDLKRAVCCKATAPIACRAALILLMDICMGCLVRR